MRRLCLATSLLTMMACSPVPNTSADGDTGGGTGGATGGTTGGQPQGACQPGGLLAGEEDVDAGVVLDAARGTLTVPGSDGRGHLLEDRASFTVRVNPEDAPPARQLQVTVNGCPLSQLNDPGHEYIWNILPGDTQPFAEPGKYMVMAVKRGSTVLARRSVLIPEVLPEFVFPDVCTKMEGPSSTKAAWNPLAKMATSAGVESVELSLNAQTVNDSGGGGKGTTMELDDVNLKWEEFDPDWTSLTLQAAVTYKSGMTLNLEQRRPINCE